MLSLIIFITCILVYFFLSYNDYLLDFNYRTTLLVYIASFLFLISYLFSARFIDNIHFDLLKFFYSIIIPQYIFLSTLYNLGIIGSPNFKAKSFLNNSFVSSIVNSNTIYLYNVDSKIQTLLSYYLPSPEIISSLDVIRLSNYVITSDITLLNSLDKNLRFKQIKNFDNHYLLMTIRK
tara:strand:+ start:118 stop:651 length:534 start_codon:yes stop_codon:yes gene_type:complete